MARLRVLVVLALIALLVAAWLFGTSAGRAWRLARMSTPDLMAHTLSHADDEQATRVLGARLLAQGQPDSAADVYHTASANPRATWALIAQARALLQADRPVDALGAAAEAVRREPSNAEAHAALGQAYYALANEGRAEQEFRAALAVAPIEPTALAGMARLLADRHNYEEARNRARAASSASKPASLIALGYVEDLAGNADAARRELRRAVELAPDDGEAWLLLAGVETRSARSASEIAQARQALARAERLRPNSPLTPYYQGLLLARQNRPDEAAAQFRRALERNPNSTDALYNLSLALAAAGHKQESAEALARFDRARSQLRALAEQRVRASHDQR